MEELVQEGALTDIRPTDDRHGDALLQGIADLVTMRQAPDMFTDLPGELPQLRAVGKLQFLMIGEVEFQFEERRHLQEFLPKYGQFGTEMSIELTQCHLMGHAVGRGDEVSDGLCLREIHLPVEEGATRILPRLCLTGAGADEGV